MSSALPAPLTAAGRLPVAPRAVPTADWAVPVLTGRMRVLDDEAWREFHRRYFHRLWRFAAVLHRGDDAAAEETVQQVFLRAVRHIRVFADDEILWCWLVRLARSVAADQARGRRRFLAALERWREWLALDPAAEPVPEWEPVLLECLACCPAEDRQLLHGRYFGARSLADLAAGEGLTVKAVERRLARARERLRTLLTERISTGANP